MLNFLTKEDGVTPCEYDAVQQARYILEHMLSKGWAPKVCFENEAEAAAAVKAAEAKQTVLVPLEKLEELHAVLTYFTSQVAEHHYHELVMGANDGGPTKEVSAILATLDKETKEEAGLELVPGQAKFKCWAEPYTSRKSEKTSTTAIFETVMNNDRMADIWARVDALRRPEGFTGWRCPHAWFKKIPGINVTDGESEKARQETRNGAWYDVQDALRRPDFMDDKNKDVLNKLLGV